MNKPELSEITSEPSSLPVGTRAVKLRCDGDRWSVMAETRQGRKYLGFMMAATVNALRQKGHLVERPDGMLEPLRQRERRSGGLTAQRPQRPATAPVLNEAESPLTWLGARKDKLGRPLISEDQFLAGERLRADFERSMLARRITSNWDMSAAAVGGSNGVAEIGDGTLAARQRFHAAMDAVGPELSSILLQVCCLAAGIEQAERLLDLPQRSGKAVLSLALTALSRHYGLGRAKPAATRSTLWAVPDYRPAISVPEEA